MLKANRLINEKSPYLLQHAHNPVNWYPWGEEAFIDAKKGNKPVFLSIGYSTCHWCHVMEKESFEDEEIAEMMNDGFINIKVDREERPDIDGIYMSVCQLLTGSGGWPLTVILTPEKKPFFAGTYFPKESRFGKIGMSELIPQIKRAWEDQQNQIQRSTEEIISALSPQPKAADEEIDKSVFESAYDSYLKNYDQMYGGFGSAPKFPSPHNLLFLLRYSHSHNDKFALEMVENTLLKMRKGGIFDHIGYGFHRYSTDRKWIVPHFEKMLYDQALLSSAYIETYQASGKKIFRKTAEDIFEYVLRDMTSSGGAFYSAEDADSEGEEGKFYLWTTNELRDLLDENEFNSFVSHFRIEEGGNWSDPIAGGKNGTNIIFISPENNDSDLPEEIEKIRIKLFSTREKRVHPFKDDKILTDWNSMMISALAKGGAVFEENKFTKAAVKAMEFILTEMFTPEGSLLHRHRSGESSIIGTIDDYAFTIQALLDLYESTFDPAYILKAVSFEEITKRDFWDNQVGGYFFASSKNEELIIRQKEIYDGAIPSGNSVMMLNLLRLARLTGNSVYEETASALIKVFAGDIKKMPSAYSSSLCALDFALNKTFEIVISGDQDSDDSKEILRILRMSYRPGKVILFRSEEYNDKLFRAAPFTGNQKMINGKTTVYVCSDFICNQPVHTADEMLKMLDFRA